MCRNLIFQLWTVIPSLVSVLQWEQCLIQSSRHIKNDPCAQSLLKLHAVITENNILDLSPNPQLTVNMVTSQKILLTVFTRSSVTPSGRCCAEGCGGPHWWPFTAIVKWQCWGGKGERPLDCPAWIFSMSFHRFQTEAPCPALKRAPSPCWLVCRR